MLVGQNENNHVGEIVLTTAKGGPPIMVSGMLFFGYSVQDWVCIATLIWIFIQIYIAVYNHIVKDRNVCPVCHKKT